MEPIDTYIFRRQLLTKRTTHNCTGCLARGLARAWRLACAVARVFARALALAVERGLCRVRDGGERLDVETDHSVGGEGLTGVE